MKSKQFIQTLILILISNFIFGQEAEKVILSDSDNYYLKFIPKGKPIGVLVIINGGGENPSDVMKQITLHKLAVEKNMIVIFPAINNDTEELKLLDVIFKQLTEKHKVPKDKFILGGLSGGGMLSLTYAETANKGRHNTFIIPKAIFAIDPPLDYAHLYYQSRRDVERNFSQVAVNEGKWLMDGFVKKYGGTPEEVPKEYVKGSIYSRTEKDGGNAKYLINTPVRIYTEPGIEWQMKNRQRDLYDLNCIDISAMINLLQLQGNKDAEIVVTHDKGVRLDGTKHPHSWSVMDSNDCLKWILKQLE